MRKKQSKGVFSSGFLKGFSSTLGRGNIISRAASMCLGLPGSEGESQGGTEREKEKGTQIWEGRECGWKAITVKEQRAAG